MWKYILNLSYVGSDFCGWQRQNSDLGLGKLQKPSIQATIEKALFKITGEIISVVGSGRTDSGVHAIGQVAHFVLRKKFWELQILHRGLNSLLPGQIRVVNCCSASLDFHAQRSAVKKQYSYYFQQGSCAMPFLEPFSWWIRKKLNLEAMNEAVKTLVGEHDFKPFQASGAKPGPTVRAILEAEVSFVPMERFLGTPFGIPNLAQPEAELFLVRVRVLGTGFLKQMVRGIAGTLLQVGENRRSSQCTLEILQTQDRKLVGPTAPARALWLERVWYDSELTF